MSANTETVRRSSAPGSSTWIALGIALALAAAIVVVSLSDSGTTTGSTREPAVTVERTAAGSPDSVAEMAALKAGAFEQGQGSGVSSGTTETGPVSEAIEIANIKAALIERIQRER